MKSRKKWLIALAPALVPASVVAGLLIYLTDFETLSDDHIVTHGWKGGACESLPDVLDFRDGRLTLRGDRLYFENKPLGRIVKKVDRYYADPYLTVRTETGELCTFWDKWTN